MSLGKELRTFIIKKARVPETSKDLFPTRRNKFECLTQTVKAAQ